MGEVYLTPLPPPLPEKTTLKKPSFIRIKLSTRSRSKGERQYKIVMVPGSYKITFQ